MKNCLDCQKTLSTLPSARRCKSCAAKLRYTDGVMPLKPRIGTDNYFFGRDMSGANNARWISDRTKLAKLSNGNEYRNSPAHKEWSRDVKNRDGWKCRISNGDCSGQIVAHHILPWRDYENLRYEPNNGITLCRFHHPRKRVDEMKLSPYFQQLVMSNRN